MPGLKSNYVFTTLTIVSALLIWGVAVRNRLIILCGDAAESQELPGGIPLRTRYTGIPPLDFIITTQVIFFHDIVKSEPWMMINGFSLAFAIMVCQMVESLRKSAQGKRSVELAGTWNVVGQHLGVGMLNPVYYSYHVEHATLSATNASSFSIPAHQAAAILPSVFLGAICLCYILITQASSLDTDTYQKLLALVQPFGLWVSALQLLFSTILGRITRSSSRDSDLPYLRAIYALTFIFATTLHNYSRFGHTIPASNSSTAFSWLSLYTPTFSHVKELRDVVVVFMRNDILVLGWGAVLWAGWLLAAERRIQSTAALFAFGLVGYVVLGPGATCVGGMWIREEMARKPQQQDEKAVSKPQKSLGFFG